jgi:hypothetical protein
MTGMAVMTLPRSSGVLSGSVAPGIFHDNAADTGHPSAASAWNDVVATRSSRRNTAAIIPTGAVSADTTGGGGSPFGGSPFGGSPFANGGSPTSIIGVINPNYPYTSGPGPLSYLNGSRPFIVGGIFDTIFARAHSTHFGAPATPPGAGPTPTPTPPAGPPVTGTPPGSPIDPALQALAALFGGGGSSSLNPAPYDAINGTPAAASSGPSGLMVLGAVAGIAGLAYYIWREHKKKGGG